MKIEPYQPSPGETCGKKSKACDKGPVIARIVSGGWVVFLCNGCLDVALKELAAGPLKRLPILGIIPEVP
jgi:hypothetical protein